MSIEQVLVMLAVLALPLLESMFRAARRRRVNVSSRTESLPTRVPRQPVRDLQPLPVPADSAPLDAISSPERKPGQDAHARVVRTIVRSARPGSVIEALYRPHDLRRAIVLMTVLGPARAIQPYDDGLVAQSTVRNCQGA